MKSSYEFYFAELLDRLGKDWLYEPKRFEYKGKNGFTKNYIPDFYLVAQNIYVEAKGARFTDKYKMDERKHDEPNKDCDVCGGEGWLYSEELHKVRRRITTPPPGQAGIEEQADFAIMNVPYIIYYFKYYVNPTEQDRIVEIDNNLEGEPTRPFVKRSIYNITLAEPFRDLNGRIEYWRCAVKKEELRYGRTL